MNCQNLAIEKQLELKALTVMQQNVIYCYCFCNATAMICQIWDIIPILSRYCHVIFGTHRIGHIYFTHAIPRSWVDHIVPFLLTYEILILICSNKCAVLCAVFRYFTFSRSSMRKYYYALMLIFYSFILSHESEVLIFWILN